MDVTLTIILIVMLYVMAGFLILAGAVDFGLLDDVNPLWKIPIVIFWPLSWFFMIGGKIARMIIEYIEEVKDWREEHRKDKEER
jgi:hypothetical protein